MKKREKAPIPKTFHKPDNFSLFTMATRTIFETNAKVFTMRANKEQSSPKLREWKV